MKAERTSTLKAHSAPLYALAPGRNLGTLFSGGGDRVIAEWDLSNEQTNPFGIRTDATIYSLLNIDQENITHRNQPREYSRYRARFKKGSSTPQTARPRDFSHVLLQHTQPRLCWKR